MNKHTKEIKNGKKTYKIKKKSKNKQKIITETIPEIE